MENYTLWFEGWEAATEKDPIKVAQLTEKIQRYTKSSKSKEEQSHIETDLNFNDQFRKLDILSSLIYTVTIHCY